MLRDVLRFVGALLCALSLMPLGAIAQETVAPHFASVRRDEAYLREGPSYAHRILWVYKRRNYPVWILSGYGEWLHVRDPDGAIGWMHHTQVSDRRSVLFLGHAMIALRQSAGRGTKTVAMVEPGVVAWLKACEPSACEVDAQGFDGWADKKDLWGVARSEVFR